MKFKPLAASMAALAALTMVGTLPAVAQPPQAWTGPGPGGWDRDTFWRGAPDDPYQRIAFLQHRIDRGIAEGSLDPREARRSQYQLNGIRSNADQMRSRHRGRLSQSDYQYLQNQLDQLSQQLHWRRQGPNYGGGYGAPPPPPPGNYVTSYDASHYYRDGPNYQEHRLSDQDEVYRGSDGRYYCKRGDGTTGLIVGAAAGGILGNVIDGGHNRAAGTLTGGALGALAGKSIAQNNDIRCR